jgi:uncharacterized protein with FMN-binding domain
MTTTRARRAAGLVGMLGAVAVAVTLKDATGGAASVAGAPPPGSATATAAPTTAAAAATTPAPTTAGGAAAPTTGAPSTTAAPVPRAVTGSAEDNPYGTVQVRVTLDGSRITDIATVQQPQGGRSSDIASYALPQLRDEVLKAQSARVDAVSGASYDSQSYLASVQSALDRAGA